MTLEQRVDELEKRVNRYRMAMAVVVVAVCAMMVMGATERPGDIQAKNIYADNLVIRSGGQLVVKSKEGGNIIYAGTSASGDGMLGVLSKESKRLIYAGITTGGSGLLEVYSEEGRQLIYAGPGNSDGDGLLQINSKEGTNLIYIGASEKGDGKLVFGSKEGERLIYVRTTEIGVMMSLYNKTGEEIINLYADEYGNGVVGAYNRKGKGRTLESR